MGKTLRGLVLRSPTWPVALICIPRLVQYHACLPHTAAAIAIHNFPEGIATFIVGLARPQLGIALAVAIAVHNIPEGMQ